MRCSRPGRSCGAHLEHGRRSRSPRRRRRPAAAGTATPGPGRPRLLAHGQPLGDVEAPSRARRTSSRSRSSGRRLAVLGLHLPDLHAPIAAGRSAVDAERTASRLQRSTPATVGEQAEPVRGDDGDLERRPAAGDRRAPRSRPGRDEVGVRVGQQRRRRAPRCPREHGARAGRRGRATSAGLPLVQAAGPVATRVGLGQRVQQVEDLGRRRRAAATCATVAGSSRSRRVAVSGSSRWWRTSVTSTVDVGRRRSPSRGAEVGHDRDARLGVVARPALADVVQQRADAAAGRAGRRGG